MELFRNKPKLTYSGLTVILSQPSRFDLQSKSKDLLTSSKVREIFDDNLQPHFNRYHCDLRIADDTSPFLPETKCLLVLGESALHKIANVTTSIGEQRGSPLYHPATRIPIISSFTAQDCVELTNHENEYNPLLVAQQGESDEGDDTNSDSGVSEKKRHGKTNRRNYRFWFAKDVQKAIKVVLNDGKLPRDYDNEPNYILYPSADDIISVLRNNKHRALYFDIETDTNLNITCFSFAFDLDSVFVVPVITHTYSHAYPNLGEIFGALAIAIRDNILVCHNGSGFDYLVLGHKYKIAIRKVYDTLLAQNRIYPESEKSLGHSLSLPWLYQPYHKDEGNFAFGNQQQALQLWRYCGKDVSSLILLKKAQDTYAAKHVGLRSSIDHVNSYVRAYVTTTLLGIRYDQSVMESVIKKNDLLMNQCLRLLKILIGEKFLLKIRGSGKSAMPGSNKQCCAYFHGLLNYPVVGKTKEGNPSLAKKYIFKLKLKMQNPVIDVVILYRKLQHASGMLKFHPYKTQPTQNETT